MHRIQIFTVGRGRDNDLVLPHDTVSRVHAEVILCDAGRLYITDRCSTSGTFVQRQNVWVSIRQDYVSVDENLCFGEYMIKAAELRQKLARHTPVVDARRALIRNPETGAVENRRTGT